METKLEVIIGRIIGLIGITIWIFASFSQELSNFVGFLFGLGGAYHLGYYGGKR